MQLNKAPVRGTKFIWSPVMSLFAFRVLWNNQVLLINLILRLSKQSARIQSNKPLLEVRALAPVVEIKKVILSNQKLVPGTGNLTILGDINFN